MKPHLEHSCWSAGYLLAHCEGYRVESARGTHGYVEEIVRGPDDNEPVALLVRPASGRSGAFLVATDDVLELCPDTESIVMRARNQHHRPLDRDEAREPPAARSTVGSLSR